MLRKLSRKRSKTQRRRSRRKSSRPRKRSTSSGVTKCKFANDTEAFIHLNNITWNIQNYPEDATLPSTEYGTSILDYTLCSGDIKLLLPLVKVNDSSSMIIYYQERIKHKIITFGDILDKIWNFYHLTPIMPGDLTYVSISNTTKQFAENVLQNYYRDPSTLKSLRFINFLDGQTKFGGLKHQRDNIYSLRLL